MIRFEDSLTEGRVAIGAKAEDKAGALRLAASLLAGGGPADDILAAVKEREALSSTGIGHGAAVPHALFAAERPTSLAVLRLAAPVEFDAVDGAPVDLVFMAIGSRQRSSDHLQLLSKIARALHDPAFLAAARAAPTAAELYGLLRRRG